MINHISNNLLYNYYCWAWNKIYIKANGSFRCWCDKGESYVIAQQQDFNNFVDDIVNCEASRKIRLSIIFDNNLPIEQCNGCACLQTINEPSHCRHLNSEIIDDLDDKIAMAQQFLYKIEKSRNWPLGSIDYIDEIQLEPSLPCNLKCPGCPHGQGLNILNLESQPYLFPYDWFKSMINNINYHKIKVNRIHYCGKGEPTLNRSLSDMIVYSKLNASNIKQSMDTNSNQEFKDEYLLLDYINCSIDGSNQLSYEAYRKNGDLSKALDFMQKAVIRKHELNATCKINWKFILFDTNDSIESLNKAQSLSVDFGIDLLNLVLTSCGSFDNSVRPSQSYKSIEAVNSYIKSNPIFKNTVATYN